MTGSTSWLLFVFLVAPDGGGYSTRIVGQGPNEWSCREMLEQVLPTMPNGAEAMCLPVGEGSSV